jgi:hypothetical protein
MYKKFIVTDNMHSVHFMILRKYIFYLIKTQPCVASCDPRPHKPLCYPAKQRLQTITVYYTNYNILRINWLFQLSDHPAANSAKQTSIQTVPDMSGRGQPACPITKKRYKEEVKQQ